MEFSLRQVEAFHAVATRLHFGRAADSLFVSQSVVSQEVRRLEQRLGLALFDRSTRSVALTAAGAALLPTARALLASAGDFAQAAAAAGRARSGRVRLAASPSAMNEFVPRLLRAAEDDLAGIVIDDLAVETGDIERALASSEADIGIGRFLEPGPAFRTEVLRRERLLVALSTRHPLAGSPSVALAELGDLPLLLWPRERSAAYYDFLLAACAADGLDPYVLVGRPRIIGSRSYLIAENRAFGLLPESSAAVTAPGIEAIPISSGVTLPLELAWRVGEDRPDVLRVLEAVRRLGRSPAPAPAPAS
ncbi:LysR family transcriptional regulator [Herbiconiux sp. CPCC 203407]|uniref:LysR family transcriptional regulator n=1 Tax=Herbiconiux oxytropis TaxID=2970915 RepID=A0AA41XEI2_9MICO|nr:LysR family transcriptional regulator [Herbiconiux oxytropis]MCS5721102.1 LysR family transcriptional regulator [Herbiconiux oxytropis]MCS5724754.1 LysR family transcriptional regulator [Herbiconiux oxytropis]